MDGETKEMASPLYIYMSNGMAVNIPTVDWLTGWNSNREIAESITKDELICIGGSNKE